jgi:hypothetical protein
MIPYLGSTKTKSHNIHGWVTNCDGQFVLSSFSPFTVSSHCTGLICIIEDIEVAPTTGSGTENVAAADKNNRPEEDNEWCLAATVLCWFVYI